MSSFSKAYAHPGDPLPEHLVAVAKGGLACVPKTLDRVRSAVVLTGLIHDAGKATPWFQKRLRGGGNRRDKRGNHSQLGAILAHHALRDLDLGPEADWIRWTVVAGIARHHGNLTDDLTTLLSHLRFHGVNSEELRDQLRAFDGDGFRTWLDSQLVSYNLPSELPSFETDEVLHSIRRFYPSAGSPFRMIEDGFDFLTAFGAFLGADKMHAKFPQWDRDRIQIPVEAVRVFKDREFGPAQEMIDRLREDIHDEVLETLGGSEPNWIYTLTAPTGSGKTLTGLAAGLALKHSKEQDGRPSRLIYCLPFTSVIDQNSRVYGEVLEANNVKKDDRTLLVHHHLADPLYRIDDEHVEDGSELLVETWESEIIVTTFHQLVYTLFTSRNKNLKRIGSLHNAVVILDEVQAIPHRYWDDVRRMMKLTAERLNATFILMTATMPLIVDRHESVELLASRAERYRALARTTLANRTDDPITVEDLIAELRNRVDSDPGKRRIVVVNRRRTAQDVFEGTRDVPVQTAMLSTDLTPKDRKRIRGGLRGPFLLVTTQVIEAGVDISSDELIRDLAPLDSIIQSAGRCNRNFEIDRGRVDVVCLRDEGGMLAVPPYSSFLIDATREVLDGRNVVDEAEYHELAQAYFRKVQHRSESTRITDRLAEGGINRLDGPEGLQLIEDYRPRQAHFIIQGPEDRTLWDKYQEIKNLPVESREDFLERRRRFQAIKREFYKRIVNYPSDEHGSDETIPVYPEDKIYDPERGLLQNKAGLSYEIL